MEEHVHTDCRIVYFCSSVQRHSIHELHHKESPPATPTDASAELQSVYRNARALLDENQGDFNEVFLCSSSQACVDRIETVANSAPLIVLVELRNSSSALEDENDGSFSFLRTLSTDIHGARFQKHVMPFVLSIFDDQKQSQADLDQTLTNSCLQAGALEVFRSPLLHDDINRMIGHFTEKNRPPAHLIGAPMAQNLVDSIHDSSKPPRLEVYRPDQQLSEDQRKAVERAVHQWNFPAQDFNMDQLTYAALFMLEHVLRSPDLKDYGLGRKQLVAFLLATRRQYKHEREVHYHNWRHAVDVSQCIFCFLLELQLCPPIDANGRAATKSTALERLLTPRDGLILLVSAIGHDVGHPGVNNAFLVACNHPLAQTYNDKSVLENYHCAAYQQLLRRHWSSLNEMSGFRTTMISTILATDMQRHFDYMSHLGELRKKLEDAQSAGPAKWEEKERESTKDLLMALLIKAADISNVARPFDVAAKWARILMYEFARQGELESELEIPTCLFGGPPDTEDMLAAAQSQKGFLSLFGVPLFQGIASVMPSLKSAVHELEHNQTLWEEKINEEKKRREPDTAVERPHFSSVTQDDIEAAQLEHSKSEPNAVPTDALQSPSSPTRRILVEQSDQPPSAHTGFDSRRQLITPTAFDQDKRLSSSMLPPPSIFGPASASSRRSSKDVALEQLHQLNAIAQQSLIPSPHSASADADWQFQQSYPGSRRGSKDESLRTIVVTSGATSSKKLSPGRTGPKKTGASSATRQAASRVSAPAAPAEVEPTGPTAHSPPMAPSTLLAGQGEVTPPAVLAAIPCTEDPFVAPGDWRNNLEGPHRASAPVIMEQGLPSTPPPPPQLGIVKSESAHTTLREVESIDVSSPPDDPAALRESRSRTRLRGLKFWKRRRDGEDADVGIAPSASP